jgi:hypothetical protein
MLRMEMPSPGIAARVSLVALVVIAEFCMGLRPTYMNENRGESKPLRLNRRGTAKTERTLD